MGVVADRWLAEYRRTYADYERAAKRAAEAIAEVLSTTPIAIHMIDCRAKEPSSAAQKILDKQYGRPASQMTDVIGVRIITTYQHGVPQAVQRIRSKFAVDDLNSVDKTSALQTDRFGYRGVHLVISLGKLGLVGPDGPILNRVKVEVQIRSILEHAWGEIEHELRYKSGVDLGDVLSRRFNSIAGTLEMVDREFSGIVGEVTAAIHRRAEAYAKSVTCDPLDTVGLLAVLEAARPDSVRLGPQALGLPLKESSSLARLLRSIGVADCQHLKTLFDSQPVLDVIRRYSDAQGLEPEQASGYVTVGAVAGTIDPTALEAHGGLAASLDLLQALYDSA